MKMLFDSFGPHGAEEEKEGYDDALPMDYESTALELPGDLNREAQEELREQTADCDTEEKQDWEQRAETQSSDSDPLGSWTGVPAENAEETPTQDADDL